MGLTEFLDKDVKLIIETKATLHVTNQPAVSLEAEGHLSRYQDPCSDYVRFDRLSYMFKGLDVSELEDTLVKKDYITIIGLPKK